MTSFKDIDKVVNDDSTSNNIRPEFNALMELEGRTKGGDRSILMVYKNFKSKKK